MSQNKDDLDKKVVYSLSKSRIPSFKQLKYIKKVITPKELIALRISIVSLIGSFFFLSFVFLANNIEKKPDFGGEYTEGLVGSPNLINPIYSSLSDVDSDISSLVFSSLFKRNANGELIKDLVEDYGVSEDGLVYTITIKNNIKWHNGEKLTVDDIIFTFNLIKDASYESPLRPTFSGVDIERVDNGTIKFSLSYQYSAFLDLLDFGVLPQDLWYQVPANSFRLAELNIKPIGSGPFKFKSLAKDKQGIIKLYNLTQNEDYYGEKPYLKDISFKLFPNFEEAIAALGSNSIDGVSYLPTSAKEDILVREPWHFYDLDLSLLTAVFFNQEKNAFLKEKNTRVALAHAINKEKIISVLGGGYKKADGPILSSNFAYNNEIRKYQFDAKKAADLFEISGWQLVEIGEEEHLLSLEEENTEPESNKEEVLNKAKSTDSNQAEIGKVDLANNEDIEQEEESNIKAILGEGAWLSKKIDDKEEFLIITLTTVDTPENVLVATLIKEDWEKIGVKTVIKTLPTNLVLSELIKARNFEALFYGQELLADPDIYAYWHSSQIGKNGLNIAGYKNEEVDKLLEEARGALDKKARINKYKKVQTLIVEDLPAAYLYSPTYTYVQNKKIKGFDVKQILKPSNRFSNLSDWYILTKRKFTF